MKEQREYTKDSGIKKTPEREGKPKKYCEVKNDGSTGSVHAERIKREGEYTGMRKYKKVANKALYNYIYASKGF